MQLCNALFYVMSILGYLPLSRWQRSDHDEIRPMKTQATEIPEWLRVHTDVTYPLKRHTCMYYVYS